jgi:hypothetical protein
MKCKLNMEADRNLFFHVKGRTWVVGVRERRTEEEPKGLCEKICGLTDRCRTASVR